MSLQANRISLDARGLDDLKRDARESPDRALKAAATQFEALFMNMILKNMRDALPKDGLMSSAAGDTFTGMLDQQLSQKIASQGTGLADMLVKQLSRNLKTTVPVAGQPLIAMAASRNSTRVTASTAKPATSSPAIQAAPGLTAAAAERAKAASASAAERKRDFVAQISQSARIAEQATGVPAKFMIGQAALESGWGRHEIKDSRGQPAFNLFGIKAGTRWTGPTVDVTTTEFVNGVAHKVVEKFRAYASYAEGFADYAKLIAGNPRYAGVIRTAREGIEAFAQGLQRAGYATDPGYANKLARVIRDTVRIDSQA